MPPRSVLLNVFTTAKGIGDEKVGNVVREVEVGKEVDFALADAAMKDVEEKTIENMALAAPTCATCSSAAPMSGKLLRCSRCRAAFYCNTACQKADWSMHKKICRRDSGGPSPSTSNPPTPLPSSPSGYRPTSTALFPAGTGMELDLHSLDQRSVFTYLIDAYRLRVTDDFIFTGTVRQHSLRSDEPDPIRDLQAFLKKAEKCAGLLPQWWNAEQKGECEAFAGERGWQNINQEVDKGDIIEKYSDNTMPMHLRLLAEKVYGTPVTPYN